MELKTYHCYWGFLTGPEGDDKNCESIEVLAATEEEAYDYCVRNYHSAKYSYTGVRITEVKS